MRHGVKKAKFNRNMGERTALTRSLLLAFFTNERVVTTKPKAKLLKSEADRMISRAKRGGIASRRLLLQYLPNQVVVEKLIKEYAPLFADRTGGYSRIVSLGRRMSDSTPMARVELVQSVGQAAPVKPEKPDKTVKATVALPKAGKGVRVTPKKEGKMSERAGKSTKEKAVSRRQVSTRKEGKK